MILAAALTTVILFCIIDSVKSGSFADAEASSGSDDTVILTRGPRELQRAEEHRLAQVRFINFVLDVQVHVKVICHVSNVEHYE